LTHAELLATDHLTRPESRRVGKVVFYLSGAAAAASDGVKKLKSEKNGQEEKKRFDPDCGGVCRTLRLATGPPVESAIDWSRTFLSLSSSNSTTQKRSDAIVVVVDTQKKERKRERQRDSLF
jgi:hypothetical protein